jgi:entericidin A
LNFRRFKKNRKKILHSVIFFGTYPGAEPFPFRAAVIAPPQRCSATLARPAFPPPPSKRAGPFCINPDEVNMTSFRAILLALMASFLVAGCNTVKGAGRDIESVGQAGSDAIH